MIQLATQPPYSAEVQQRYRDNFARHVLGIALYLQSEIMNTLTLEHGHSQLRINYEPYIALVGVQGARLSDIADLLGISRQAANQTVNQIVSAGYLQRRDDPTDGRAKLLMATPRAREIQTAGSREAMRLQGEMAQLVGQKAVAESSAHLTRLLGALGLLLPVYESAANSEGLVLAALLPRLADYITNRLMQLTIARGHPDLKRSFGQVLTAIGPQGGRIQQMADTQDVSKQAISAVATELEELGYIQRVADDNDARQLVLHFTEHGQQLIADSVAAQDDLLAEFAGQIGEEPMAQVCATLQGIYRALHLEEDIFGDGTGGEVDIRILARQLNRQLGEAGAKALGKLLLSREIDKRQP